MKMKLKVPGFVDEVIRRVEKHGFEIYIVGGVVRDLLLKRPQYDWDFTTNATPEQIQELFEDAFYDNKFGTVGVPIEATGDSDQFVRPAEITTFRTDHGYSDGRRPDEVRWGTKLEEDLKRRDFTINAMALKKIKSGSKSGSGEFELVDEFGGEQDIKNRLIRAVGKPDERFGEDALRMMRAVRIAAQLGFAIEEETFVAIQNQSEKIKQISGERIRDELLKIMASDYPADGYTLLRNCGLAGIILPEVEAGFGVEQKSPGRHHIYDVGKHSVESLRYCTSTNPITRLATLIHDAGKVKTQRKYPDGRITFYNHEMESARIAEQISERLRLSNQQRDLLVRLVRWHQFTVDQRQTDSAIRRFIRNVGKENINEMLALRTGDRLGGGATETSWRLEEFKQRIEEVQVQPFAIPDLKINGRDVMEIKKVPSGPMVGKYLQILFDEVVEGGLKNEREVLIEFLKSIPQT